MIQNKIRRKALQQASGRQYVGAEPPTISFRSAVFSLIATVVLMVVAMVVIEKMGGVARLQNYVIDAGAWAPLIFIGVKALTFVIAPLNGAPLKIFAGAVFGFWEGIIYTLAGDVIGGSINFWIARLMGQRMVGILAKRRGMTLVDKFVNQLSGWRALLFARIVLSAVYDVVSYAAGLTHITFRQYLLVTALGGIIPVTFFVGIGARFGDDQRTLLLVYIGLGLLFLAIILMQRHIWYALQARSKTSGNLAGGVIDNTANLPADDEK